MAYAVFKSGGKQYRAKQGDRLLVDHLSSLEEGAEATFSDILLIENDGKVKIGTPIISGASITAKVIGHPRGKKVIAFKFKRRKGFHKKKGSRRAFTDIEIVSIND